MKKILLLPALLGMSLLFPVNAYATEYINNLRFSIDAPMEEVEEGYNLPGYTLYDSQGYWLSDLECLKDEDSITGNKAVPYEMVLRAKNGYRFANSVSVDAGGVESVTSVKSYEDELVIRFKAYPYVKASSPYFLTNFADICGSRDDVSTRRGTTVEIDKNGNSEIEYLIEYVDEDGDIREKHGTTTKSYLDVSKYNAQYGGTKSSKHSSYIRGIAIRGVAKSNSKHVAASDWVYISGGRTDLDVNEYFDSYDYWTDVTSRNTTRYENTYGGSNGYSVIGPSNTKSNTFMWSGSGDVWRYLCNNSVVKGWVHDGTGWYYCDMNDGVMRTGWYQDTDGRWYHLHTVHDGFYGRMDTGWYEENGHRYYFAPEVGAPEGSMTIGTRYIDGVQHMFGTDGKMIY